MTNIINKILIYVATIGIIAALVFVIFKQNQITKRQQDITAAIIEQKHLLDQIERSGGGYATTAQLEEFLSRNGFNTKNIKDDLKALDAKINSGNVITVDSNKGRTSETNIPSSSTGPENPDNVKLAEQLKCPLCDPYGYLSKQQNLDLKEKFDNIEVPFGQVSFSAFKDKPWSLNIPQRQYSVVTVVGLDENQRSYYYNKFNLSVDGKKYEIKINSAQTLQEIPKSTFSFFNPRLYLQAGGGANLNQFQGNVNLGLGIGFMSYGKFKNEPTLSILQLGAGFDFINKRPQISLAPINANIGHIFNSKLIRNTYLGPAVGINTAGNISLTLGISVGF